MGVAGLPDCERHTPTLALTPPPALPLPLCQVRPPDRVRQWQRRGHCHRRPPGWCAEGKGVLCPLPAPPLAHVRAAAPSTPLPPPPPPPPPCPCAGNMANLFTNLNMGLGTRPFASGGAGTRGAHFGACAVSAGGRVPPEGRTRARRSRPACLVACRPQQHVLEPLLDHQADPGPPHLRLWAVPQLCGVLLGQPGVAPLRTCQAACAPPHAHPHLHLTC